MLTFGVLGERLTRGVVDYNFNLKETNVVHMTVKPADFFDEDEGTGAKHHGKSGSIRVRDGGEGGAGCRCVIL